MEQGATLSQTHAAMRTPNKPHQQATAIIQPRQDGASLSADGVFDPF